MRYCPSCGARFSQEAAFCPHDGSPVKELPDQEATGDPMLGMVIDGRYHVEERIGEGGMGIVYLATHTVLGKKLALKVLRGEMARDAEVVQRFIQEAQTASSIGHRNIVDISDFGRLPDGAVYFAMEYLDGDPLSDLITRGGSVPMREAIAILGQIASALGAAHARGIVHRDLKPDNVFVLRRGDDPVVKVLDFGIAKVGGAGSKLTKTGMVFGTPHYMAPEQAAGHAVDGRTDIYALGVIMYEMFTGNVPFDADTFMGILSKHMFEQPVPPSEKMTGRQLGALEDVILKSLSKKPEDRYQTMDDLIADLDAIQAGGAVSIGGRAGARGSDGLANALEPPSRTEMRLSSPDGLPTSRAPIVVLAALAVGVLIAGGVGVGFALRHRGDDGSEATAPAEGAPSSAALAAREQPGAADAAASDAVPTGKAPPAAEEPSYVEIASDPSGAELVIDGAVVGNTPARLPRPEDGVERRVQLREKGYRATAVMLTATSPERVSVNLEPARRARRPARRRTDRSRPPAEASQSQSQKRAPEPGLVTREVVDPWAN